MSLLTVNLAAKMTAANQRSLAADQAILTEEAKMKREVAKLISESAELAKAEEQTDAMRALGLNYHIEEAAKIRQRQGDTAHLPQDRIFTWAAIRDICIKYNLRFLPSSTYRGALDEGIPAKLEEFKTLNQGKMPNSDRFWIAAPAESFQLQPRPKDPLLFCQISGDRYFLIHKWGSDLSVLRRVYAFCMEHLFTLLVTICLTVGVTLSVRYGEGDLPVIGNAIFGLLFGAIPIIPLAIFFQEYPAPSRVWNSPWDRR